MAFDKLCFFFLPIANPLFSVQFLSLDQFKETHVIVWLTASKLIKPVSAFPFSTRNCQLRPRNSYSAMPRRSNHVPNPFIIIRTHSSPARLSMTSSDVGKSIGTIDGLLAYLSVIGQAPWLHKILLGNPIMPLILPLESSNEVQNVSFSAQYVDKQLLTIVSQFAVKIINKRINGEQKNPKRDILARLLEVNQQDASKLTVAMMTHN